MNQTERQLVKKLAEKLAHKFDRIETHRKPSASTRVREYLQSQLSYVPVLQPELDMILWERSGGIVAVEVKAFNPSATNRMHPFYGGIGQALALHRFGFDYASLWFLFLDTDREDANRYGAETWAFIRNDMRLPLDFTYFQVEKTVDSNVVFHTMQYTGRQSGKQLLDIDHHDFKICFRHPNPMRPHPTQQVVRRALELWFDNSL